MPTMRDVAERANVSIATVSHVINETRYVSPALTQRVRRAMAELNYHRNDIARALTGKRTKTIGLVISDIANPVLSTLARGVENFLFDNKYSVILCNTDETQLKEDVYIDTLLGKKVDGLIIAPAGKSQTAINKVLEKSIPVVFVDRVCGDLLVDAALSENRQGAYAATQLLLSNGHTRIGIILGLSSVSTTHERLAGYEDALKEKGIPLEDELLVHGNSQIDEAKVAFHQLMSLESPPTAIFSTNNLMTLGVMIAASEHSFACPEDLSVVGFDDFPWTSAFEPQLTTVVQDPNLMGLTAAKILIEKLERQKKQPQVIRLPTRLIIRNSVAPLTVT